MSCDYFKGLAAHTCLDEGYDCSTSNSSRCMNACLGYIRGHLGMVLLETTDFSLTAAFQKKVLDATTNNVLIPN
jgi:hypothetical protein